MQLIKILAPDIPLKELNEILKKISYLEYDIDVPIQENPPYSPFLKEERHLSRERISQLHPPVYTEKELEVIAPVLQKCAQLQDLTVIKELDIMAEYLITHQDKFATALHLVRKVLKTRKLNWKNRQNSVKKDNGMDNSTSANIPRISTTRTITTPTNISDITTQ